MQERFSIDINVPILTAEQRFKETEKDTTKDKTEKATAEERFKKAIPKKKEDYLSGQLKKGGSALLAGAAAFVISNTGTLTGSQAAQNTVNNIAKIAGLGVAIATNPAIGLAATAFVIANNAVKIAKETREWNLSEVKNSERIGLTASQRGR